MGAVLRKAKRASVINFSASLFALQSFAAINASKSGINSGGMWASTRFVFGFLGTLKVKRFGVKLGKVRNSS